MVSSGVFLNFSLSFCQHFLVSHFIAIIKDLKTPSEVADFVKNFLGNNSSSLSFVRFFISKKTYLINKMNSKTNDDIMRENIEVCTSQGDLF